MNLNFPASALSACADGFLGHGTVSVQPQLPTKVSFLTAKHATSFLVGAEVHSSMALCLGALHNPGCLLKTPVCTHPCLAPICFGPPGHGSANCLSYKHDPLAPCLPGDRDCPVLCWGIAGEDGHTFQSQGVYGQAGRHTVSHGGREGWKPSPRGHICAHLLPGTGSFAISS